MATDDRFSRQLPLLGEEGQSRIARVLCAIVGLGGIGSHLVQQLVLLGVEKFLLIDHEELALSNLNRYIGVRFDDKIPGTLKVDIAERQIRSVNPRAEVSKVASSFISSEGFERLKGADFVFGSVDTEGARWVLNEFCSAYQRPYFDLATDVIPGEPIKYGGRIIVAKGGSGCLVCRGVLDEKEARIDLESPMERKTRREIYGVSSEFLGQTGPSVVSLNGVIASLAVTEFMACVTGLREPNRFITYHGYTGKVTLNADLPAPDCWYCKAVYGKREHANVEGWIPKMQLFNVQK